MIGVKVPAIVIIPATPIKAWVRFADFGARVSMASFEWGLGSAGGRKSSIVCRLRFDRSIWIVGRDLYCPKSQLNSYRRGFVSLISGFGPDSMGSFAPESPLL